MTRLRKLDRSSRGFEGGRPTELGFDVCVRCGHVSRGREMGHR